MQEWIFYSIFAMVLFGISNFLIKFIKEAYYEIFFVQAFFFMVVAFILLFTGEFKIETQNTILLIILGILFALAGICSTLAIKTSQNPGIALALINMNTLVTFVLSITLLKSPYNIRSVIGVLLAILAITLLLI